MPITCTALVVEIGSVRVHVPQAFRWPSTAVVGALLESVTAKWSNYPRPRRIPFSICRRLPAAYDPGMLPRHSIAALPALLVLAVLAAGPSCHRGPGSDIGPNFAPPPATTLSGVVVDPAGLPITGASSTIAGSGSRATSARSGRFVFGDPPLSVPLRLTIDGSAGTADAMDRFPMIVVAAPSIAGTDELDPAVVLPDLNAGASRTENLGASAGFTLDDSGNAGGTLVVASGTVLGRGGSTGSVTITLTNVGPDQLPVDLSATIGDANVTTRGVWLTPTDLTFAGTVDFSVPTTLGLGAGGKANLYRLDPVTGAWTLVGPGTAQAGGSITLDTSALPGGGCYVFATAVATATILTGRAVDKDKVPIPGAIVTSVLGKSVRAAQDGSFSLGPLPAVDAGSNPLSLDYSVRAPRGYEPVRVAATVTASAGSTDVGDVTIDTFATSTLRALLTERGRLATDRRIEVGVQPQIFGEIRQGGREGIVVLQDVPVGYFNIRGSWVENNTFFRGYVPYETLPAPVFDTRGLVGSVDPRGAEWLGAMRAFALDEEAGAPLLGAVFQGAHRSDSGSATTDREGVVFGNGDRYGVSSMSFESTIPGLSVTSVVSITKIDTARTEFPQKVARAPRVGNFDPHGVLEGDLTNTGAGTERRMIVRPVFRTTDFWHRVLTGRTFAGSLPRADDPDVTAGTSYRLGVPTGGSYITGIEGVLQSGVLVPQRIGVLVDLLIDAGTVVNQDLALDHPIDQTLALPGAIAGLDGDIATTSLRYELGLRRPDGLALDLLPEVGGVVASAPDVTIPVPALTGPLAGGVFLVALRGSDTRANGADVSQASFTEAATSPVTPPVLLPVPEVQSPTPNQTVSASGFDVTWTWPSGVADPNYFVIELSTVNGTDDRYWTVYVRGDLRVFEFGRLVPSAPNPLVAGRTYDLRITAHRVDKGVTYSPDINNSYQRIIGNLYSLRAGARGSAATASYAFKVTTN